MTRAQEARRPFFIYNHQSKRIRRPSRSREGKPTHPLPERKANPSRRLTRADRGNPLRHGCALWLGSWGLASFVGLRPQATPSPRPPPEPIWFSLSLSLGIYVCCSVMIILVPILDLCFLWWVWPMVDSYLELS
jgi:hypothetical protein